MARLAQEEREKQRRVGERIAEAREARRLTQPVVADRVGVSLRAYQNWESGATRVAWTNLPKLAKILGASEDYLLSGEGREPAVPVPTDLNQQFGEIDARLANIEEMLSQLLDQRQADPEQALATAVGRIVEGVRATVLETSVPKETAATPKRPARRAQ